MNILSFDVGGTSIKYGIVNEHSEISMKGSIKTPDNENSFLEVINSIINKCDSKLNKISIAMPGFVDKKNATYLYGTNIKYKIDFNKIKDFNYSDFIIDNDGNVAAYAEYQLNYKDKVKNLIMLTFGTGIGGGIINNGNLVRGNSNAGELGHILISEKTEIVCNCGKKGCLESIVSARSWTERCKDLSHEEPDSELAILFSEKKVGSILFNQNINLTKKQIAVKDEIITYISRGLVSIFEIFNNELFILGGSMSKEPYDLVKLIKHNIDKNFEFIGREFPDIKISNFQSDSGLIGAALLAQHE